MTQKTNFLNMFLMPSYRKIKEQVRKQSGPISTSALFKKENGNFFQYLPRLEMIKGSTRNYDPEKWQKSIEACLEE